MNKLNLLFVGKQFQFVLCISFKTNTILNLTKWIAIRWITFRKKKEYKSIDACIWWRWRTFSHFITLLLKISSTISALWFSISVTGCEHQNRFEYTVNSEHLIFWPIYELRYSVNFIFVWNSIEIAWSISVFVL